MCHEILVVDDSDTVLALMELILTRRGFVVLKARSAEQALDVLSRTTPDLIILDLMMPDVDGIELCRMIRTHAQTVEVPVIIQSARFEAQLKQRGLAVGANDYVSKLIPPRELVTKIEQMLNLNGRKFPFQ
jgi:DNA-binding response OmpR family regulator